MPPVEVDYTPKGSDIKIQGMKTCQYILALTHAHTQNQRTDKTGSPSATTAILLIGDVFGNLAQVLQVRCLLD